MDILTAVQANLLSPAVLFFVLGLIAALTKSDLKFPEPLYVGLTIYLLIAIGFKGGVAISEAGLAKVWLPALAAMGLGALIMLNLFIGIVMNSMSEMHAELDGQKQAARIAAERW